jgi:hypothetical protein
MEAHTTMSCSESDYAPTTGSFPGFERDGAERRRRTVRTPSIITCLSKGFIGQMSFIRFGVACSSRGNSRASEPLEPICHPVPPPSVITDKLRPALIISRRAII